jgi:hypothetical protein
MISMKKIFLPFCLLLLSLTANADTSWSGDGVRLSSDDNDYFLEFSYTAMSGGYSDYKADCHQDSIHESLFICDTSIKGPGPNMMVTMSLVNHETKFLLNLKEAKAIKNVVLFVNGRYTKTYSVK